MESLKAGCVRDASYLRSFFADPAGWSGRVCASGHASGHKISPAVWRRHRVVAPLPHVAVGVAAAVRLARVGALRRIVAVQVVVHRVRVDLVLERALGARAAENSATFLKCGTCFQHIHNFSPTFSELSLIPMNVPKCPRYMSPKSPPFSPKIGGRAPQCNLLLLFSLALNFVELYY